MPSTYTKPNPRTHKRRDYDRQILSDADYAALQGYQSDYQNATTDAQRQQAHQAAEDLRNSYGYSLGADGAIFTVAGRPGVSQETNLHLLQLEQGPQWSQDYDAAYHELLSGAGGNNATKTEQAERLILDLLADGKELASEDIVKAAAEAGISERTVQNAKRNMGGILGARRVGGQWYNFIKKKQPPEPAS